MTGTRVKVAASSMRVALWGIVGLFGLASCTGCVVVGASSRGGFFLWPGGVGLLVLILLVMLILRRR